MDLKELYVSTHPQLGWMAQDRCKFMRPSESLWTLTPYLFRVLTVRLSRSNGEMSPEGTVHNIDDARRTLYETT